MVSTLCLYIENYGFLDGILWWRPGRGARGARGARGERGWGRAGGGGEGDLQLQPQASIDSKIRWILVGIFHCPCLRRYLF